MVFPCSSDFPGFYVALFSVGEDFPVAGQERQIVVPRGGDQKAVRGIAVYVSGKKAAVQRDILAQSCQPKACDLEKTFPDYLRN